MNAPNTATQYPQQQMMPKASGSGARSGAIAVLILQLLGHAIMIVMVLMFNANADAILESNARHLPSDANASGFQANVNASGGQVSVSVSGMQSEMIKQAQATVMTITVVMLIQYGLGLIWAVVGLVAHVQRRASLMGIHLGLYVVLILANIITAIAIRATGTIYLSISTGCTIAFYVLFAVILYVHYKHCRKVQLHNAEKS